MTFGFTIAPAPAHAARLGDVWRRRRCLREQHNHFQLRTGPAYQDWNGPGYVWSDYQRQRLRFGFLPSFCPTWYTGGYVKNITLTDATVSSCKVGKSAGALAHG